MQQLLGWAGVKLMTASLTSQKNVTSINNILVQVALGHYSLVGTTPFHYWKINNYRKSPSISCTFFLKVQIKNSGCGLSKETAGVGLF